MLLAFSSILDSYRIDNTANILDAVIAFPSAISLPAIHSSKVDAVRWVYPSTYLL